MCIRDRCWFRCGSVSRLPPLRSVHTVPRKSPAVLPAPVPGNTHGTLPRDRTPAHRLSLIHILFDINGNVDALPSRVFYDLEIETILLLEASSSQIIKNLSVRDKKEYSESQILLLQKAEQDVYKRQAYTCNYNI